MMEQGTIVSAEVLPKVAKEFAKAARGGGALAQALKTVRVQQGKFLTDLQKSQNTIFKSGFGDGLASFYRTMSKIFKDLEPILKGVGQGFGFLFKTLAAGINILTAPLRSIKLITDLMVDLDEVSSNFSENTVPKMVAAGALMLTAWGRVLVKFIAIKGVLEELIGMSLKGVRGQLERDLDMDFGLDAGIGDGTRSGANPSLQKDATDFDRVLKFYNSPDRFSAVDWVKDMIFSKDTATEPKVSIQPVIDHSGGYHIETSIERSIINGQAQR